MDLKDKDGKMLELMEACISTWTDMTIADGEREGAVLVMRACGSNVGLIVLFPI